MAEINYMHLSLWGGHSGAAQRTVPESWLSPACERRALGTESLPVPAELSLSPTPRASSVVLSFSVLKMAVAISEKSQAWAKVRMNDSKQKLLEEKLETKNAKEFME